MHNNSPLPQNQTVFSQIPLSEIFEGFRAIVREEMNAGRDISEDGAKEVIDSKELLKRLNISEPTLVKWRQKKKVPYLQIGTAIRSDWNAVIRALEQK